MPAMPVVTLQDVTKENLYSIFDLKVGPEQRKFISSNVESIAEAHFYPEVAWFRAIYADVTPVGFVLLADDAVAAKYILWRFMIDAQFQRQGLGRRAFELVLEYVQTRPGAKVFEAHCGLGEGSPQGFYEKLGFVSTGEFDEGELVMQYQLMNCEFMNVMD
jgi:diamine N-acetyltransferase